MLFLGLGVDGHPRRLSAMAAEVGLSNKKKYAKLGGWIEKVESHYKFVSVLVLNYAGLCRVKKWRAFAKNVI